MNLRVRHATLQDIDQLCDLSCRQSTAHSLSLDPMVAELLKNRLASKECWSNLLSSQFEKNPLAVLVAEDARGDLLGTTILECTRSEVLVSGNKTGTIHWLVVRSEAQNKGIGTMLLHHAGEFFHDAGCIDCQVYLTEQSELNRFFASRRFIGMREMRGVYRFVNRNILDMRNYLPPLLFTERILLRPLGLDDLIAVFKYAKNPRVAKYTLWDAHQSQADTLSFLKHFVADSYRKRNPDPFGIVMRKSTSQEVVGTVGCFWISKQHSTMELGYALGEEHWGQGIATESSKAVLQYVFESFQVERVVCRCITENEGSKMVMDKLGFKKEGIQRHAVFRHGKYWDLYTTAMLRGEYLSHKAKWNAPLL